jgi:hypothetical protein
MRLRLYFSDNQLLMERRMNAYGRILKLTPTMASTIAKLCDAARALNEDIDESSLHKFIELVSYMVASRHSVF